MDKLWDPFNTEYIGNPYPMYDQLREKDPIHRAQSGDFVVSGYADVKRILLDSKNFRVGNRFEWISRQVAYLENKEEDLTGITAAMNSFLVQMNGQEHVDLRSLIVDAWSDHNVNEIIDSNISQLLQRLNPKFDLIKDFAAPLPVMTMARIMGMEPKDYAHLKSLTADLLLCLDMYTSFKTLVQIDKASRSFMEYVSDYLDYREHHLSTDLTSKIILLAKSRNIKLSRKQLISACIFLFMAGEETTVNLIGTGALNIIANKDQLESLKKQPLLWDNAVEETLRYESPVQLAGRIANNDVVLNGVKIKKENTLTLCIGSANRDPKIFNDPEKFDISRNAKNHLAFGAGVHFCLGSWLAKLQWKMALKSLFKEHSDLQIAGDSSWNPMLSIRGLKSLPVSK